MIGKSTSRARIDQRGETNVFLLPLILAVVFLLVAIGFGAWAFSSREDYRVNVQKKIDIAVTTAKKQEDIVKDQEHAEADKQPLKSYKGQEQYGSIQLAYPKTWSGYVTEASTGSLPLDGYFQPGVIPNIVDATIALRVQLIDKSYASVVKSHESDVKTQKLTAAPYAFAKVPDVVGIRYEGAIDTDGKKTGIQIAVPVRDKTLLVWTESPTYYNDFNSLILPNVQFVP